MFGVDGPCQADLSRPEVTDLGYHHVAIPSMMMAHILRKRKETRSDRQLGAGSRRLSE